MWGPHSTVCWYGTRIWGGGLRIISRSNVPGMQRKVCNISLLRYHHTASGVPPVDILVWYQDIFVHMPETHMFRRVIYSDLCESSISCHVVGKRWPLRWNVFGVKIQLHSIFVKDVGTSAYKGMTERNGLPTDTRRAAWRVTDDYFQVSFPTAVHAAWLPWLSSVPLRARPWSVQDPCITSLSTEAWIRFALTSSALSKAGGRLSWTNCHRCGYYPHHPDLRSKAEQKGGFEWIVRASQGLYIYLSFPWMRWNNPYKINGLYALLATTMCPAFNS